MAEKLKFRNTILLSWLIPLLLLFIAPTTVIGIIHSNSVRAMREEVERVYVSELTNLKNIVDFHLSEMNRIALELSLNNDVLALIYAESVGPHERLLSYFIQSRLRDYSFTSFAVSYIAIGNFDTDFVISNMSSYTMQDFLATRFGSYSDSHLEANVYKNDFVILRDSDTGREFISYTLSLPLELGSANNAFVTIFISNEFTQMLAEGLVDRTLFIRIDGDVLQIGEDVSADYAPLLLMSALPGISYEYMISIEEHSAAIQRINLITQISLSICVFLCLFILIYFLRQNYIPIARIFRKFTEDEQGATVAYGSELGFIELSLTKNLKEIGKLKTELDKHTDIARDLLVTKLLLGDISAEELQNISSLVSFDGELFFVAALKPSEAETMEENLSQSTVRKSIDDLANEGYKLYSVVLYGALIALFDCRKGDVDLLLARLKEMPAGICVGISQTSINIEDISDCYAQAEETLSYCVIFNNSCAIYKTDYRARIEYASDARSIFETNQKFRNAIVTADFKAALQMVDPLFHSCFYPDQPVNELRLNIYSIVILFCSSLVEFSKRHGNVEISIENVNATLLQSVTIEQLKKNLIEQLNKLLESCKDLDDYQLDEFKNKLIQYIDANYQNYELSVSSIAEHFNMSVSYTSKTFKKLTGVGLLNYIHQVRLKNAKELLESKLYSVKEIAVMVGYNDASSFIRTFKKYEGISPGKY